MHTGCPLCSQSDGVSIGSIRHFPPEELGGIDLNPLKVTFELVRCRNCHFTYKTPPLDQELLLKGYSLTPADHWDTLEDGHHRQFDYMEKILHAQTPGNTILDVGCFNGELLRHFGSWWRRFAVEPSTAAAEVARSKGITILGPTIDSLSPDTHAFDCIVAVDVLEHLPHPASFFNQAAKLLKPRGLLLIVTGDADARSWRLYGSHYWYCSYIGHIGFLNKPSIQWIGRKFSLDLVHYERRSHERANAMRHLKDWIKGARYVAASIFPFLPMAWSARVPHWISARDHMFALLIKQK